MGIINGIHTLSLLLFCLGAHAQQEARLSIDANGYTLTRLAAWIQANSGYQLYYDPAETDSVVVHGTFKDVSLSVLLDSVCRGTAMHFVADADGRVFITKDFRIIAGMPFPETGTGATTARDSAVRFFASPENPAGRKKINGLNVANKIIEIGSPALQKGGPATIAGYIRNGKNGEPVSGGNISIDSSKLAMRSDQYGYYTASMSAGSHLLHFSSAGMKETVRRINVYSDGELDVEMLDDVANLKTVIVSAEKNSNTRSLQMGTEKLDIKTIKYIPAVLGEADVVKALLTLPGVTSVGEAANGFNVRGGSADQNLILFSDATIYNPSHLFGFFSSFNPDIVKSVELYKTAIPEKYGGRLASVLDVAVRDGNNKQWTGIVGIGPLTGRIMAEGPLQKDKTSVIVSARGTYSDWLLKAVPNKAYDNSSANFYDANIHLTHLMDKKNTLYLTGYVSTDKFNLNSDTTYRYKNLSGNLKWKHLFSNKSFAVVTTGMDHYQYDVSSDNIPVNAFRLGYSLNQSFFRADFSYSPDNKQQISYGLTTAYYKMFPGDYSPQDKASLVIPKSVSPEQGVESAAYLGDQVAVTDKLSVHGGVRFSVFNYLGPHKEYKYLQGYPRQESTITDSALYPSGKIIKTYSSPEFRFSARYSLSSSSSVKVSFNSLSQYIHMLSNTTSISPTDIWKLSDPNIKPQRGMQYSLGYYKDFPDKGIETSLEVYYKTMKNFLDYKSGADLVLNNHIETDVFTTKGKAYGIELLVKKTTGKLNGWVSYTYSRTLLVQDDPLAGQTINGGKYYPASFDKPHNANVTANYHFSHRLSVSGNATYSTGRPITLPLAIFTLDGTRGLYYSERNKYRIPDYFRVDLSVTLEGNHNLKKVSHNFWSLGIYNLTARQNAYSVYFTEQNGQIKGYKLSVFGTLIPFITYNIKF